MAPIIKVEEVSDDEPGVADEEGYGLKPCSIPLRRLVLPDGLVRKAVQEANNAGGERWGGKIDPSVASNPCIAKSIVIPAPKIGEGEL